MLKCDGEVLAEWVMVLCGLAWEQNRIPDNWKIRVIVLPLEGKGDR